MLKFKFDPTWEYVDVYFDDIKIKTVNYVKDFEQALSVAKFVYDEYVKFNQ